MGTSPQYICSRVYDPFFQGSRTPEIVLAAAISWRQVFHRASRVVCVVLFVSMTEDKGDATVVYRMELMRVFWNGVLVVFLHCSCENTEGKHWHAQE
jgi:hypothetical protein